MSTLSWHHSRPSGAGEWLRGIRDTGAVIWSTISLQGSRIRRQTWPWEPWNGFSGRHPPPPYCLVTHVREAALSGVGVQIPRVGLHGFASSPCLWAFTSREDGGGSCWQGGAHFPAQSTSVSALGDYAPKPRTFHQRETSLDNTDHCFLCLWLDTPLLEVVLTSRPVTSLGHTSQLPWLLLERSFIMIVNLSGFGFFPLWSWMKWNDKYDDRFSLCILAICTHVLMYLNIQLGYILDDCHSSRYMHWEPTGTT